MIQELLEEFERRVQAKRSQIVERMIAGDVSNMEQYRDRVGRVSGLKESVDILKEAAEKLKYDE